MLVFGPEVCTNFEAGSQREWLETNGLGGFASSTLLGLNTRRYHGLLTAGRTVCEAFVVLHWLERACQAQVMAMACNTELNHAGADVIKLTNERYAPGKRRKITELEWPALLRMLDRRDPSFRE